MLQLSIFEHITPHHNRTLLRFPNPRKAEKLRDLADSMSDKIEEKLNPAIANQRPTARRARIAGSIREDGEKLQQIQSWLYAMADAAAQGVLPDILDHITTKSQLDLLFTFFHQRWPSENIKQIFLNPNGYYSARLKRLHRAKIYNVKQVTEAIASLY